MKSAPAQPTPTQVKEEVPPSKEVTTVEDKQPETPIQTTEQLPKAVVEPESKKEVEVATPIEKT